RAVWQFLAAFPLMLAAGAALRWGQTTNDGPATRRHRAYRAPRAETYSDTREVQTMALAHIPNGGDGERAVPMGATAAVAASLPPAPRRYAIGNASAVRPAWRRRVIAPFHMFIPLDRDRPQAAIHAMEDILERGNTLIIFPEGGIGPGDGHVRPLQSGTAYL